MKLFRKNDICVVVTGFVMIQILAFASVDYPGYGCSAGTPDEAGCHRNVNRLYDWLVNEKKVSPANITVVGFSIGTRQRGACLRCGVRGNVMV